MMKTEGQRKISLTEAANLLQELGICKAFRAGGKINSPNCYRFGHKHAVTGRWNWDMAELIEIARRRQSASISLINEVMERYESQKIASVTKSNVEINRPPNISGQIRNLSRADIEKYFRDDVRTLELLMKNRCPNEGLQDDRRTLGSIINEFEHRALFEKVEVSEAWFVNSIRNALNHPNLGDVTDDRLNRGLESVRALIRILRALRGGK